MSIENEMHLMSETIQQHREMIRKTAFYMKFFAFYNIICGAVVCLGIISAIIGIPMIIMGLRFKESAEDFEELADTGNMNALLSALNNQGRSMKIQMILIIISLAILVLYIIAIIFLIASGLINPNQFE